jgi:hypothetical protein
MLLFEHKNSHNLDCGCFFLQNVAVWKGLEHVWDLVTWSKMALFRQFFTFFQLRSPTMRLQKGKKLTKNSSFLSQAPNPKHALRTNGISRPIA